MRRRAALLAATALLALPAAASAETLTIRIPGKYFDPPRSTAVAGDVILFDNNDLSTHDVRIAGGLFDSGPLPRFSSWSQAIDQPGSYPFICTLHAFMSGQLDVVAATLSAAPDGVLAGEPLTLTGRAPAGTAQVGIEQSVAGGDWMPAGSVTPAPDGTYRTTAPAVEGSSYRATTPAGAGQVVTPRVMARVDVKLHVARAGRRTLVHVQTAPATTGFLATLERYSRWHFRWRAERSTRLDADGHASFRVAAGRRALVRVTLRRSRTGPALVHSGVVRLRTGRAAVDPVTITPHGDGPAPAGGGPPGPHGGYHP